MIYKEKILQYNYEQKSKRLQIYNKKINISKKQKHISRKSEERKISFEIEQFFL